MKMMKTNYSMMVLKEGGVVHDVKYYNDDTGGGATACGVRVGPWHVTPSGIVTCEECKRLKDQKPVIDLKPRGSRTVRKSRYWEVEVRVRSSEGRWKTTWTGSALTKNRLPVVLARASSRLLGNSKVGPSTV
jgi:hypothetical protein